MQRPLEGVKVVELATWTFVPAAAAILGDLGADVIKIEPPTGDPQRGLKNMLNMGDSGPNPFLEIPNRGKRSVTVDLAADGGRNVLLRLAAEADVFLTSYLGPVRQKFGIDVADLRAVNPRLIYARGSGWGTRGPMADIGAFDLAAGWATSGLGRRLTPKGGEPPMQPPAFFDLQGATALAGAVGMALFARERSGEGGVVDVSLMNIGMWQMSPDIISAPWTAEPVMSIDRQAPVNPITNWYRSKDDRWIYLACLQADRFWPELVKLLGAPELADDPRYANAAVRYEHRQDCVQELDRLFATKTIEEWEDILADFSGVWAPILDFLEVREHRQVEPNGFMPTITANDGSEVRIVSVPMRFDDSAPKPQGPAPEVGQHTEEILLELGMDWDEISVLREKGALG